MLPAWKVVLSRLLSGPLSWVFRPGHRAPVWLAFLAPAGRGLPSSPAMAPWVAHRFRKRFPFLFDVFLFRFAVSPSASRPQTRPSPSGLQDLRACGAWVPPHGARRQPGAWSPSTPPHGGSRRRLRVAAPFTETCRAGRGPVRGPRPPRLARPSRPPFPLLLRRLHFHSPVRLKLSHPVSHPSWTFQNWEERFVFLTVSVSLPRLATLVSLRSWPVPRAPPRPRPPSSAAPAVPRAVPTWGCVSAAPFPRRVPPTPSLVLRCWTPSSYLSRRGPVFGLVGPAFVSVALCVAGLSRRLVLGVPQAPVTRPGSACKPRLPASRQDVAGGWVSSSATTRRSLPGAPAGRPGGE